jgi:NAD+ kinase
VSYAHNNSTYVNNHWFHSQAKNNKLRIRKVLIVTKITRYEFEKIRRPDLSDQQLEEKLRNRGTDFDALMHYHNLHKKTEQNVIKCFSDLGVEVKVVNRLNINQDLLQWTDLLVPVGGDGTFLLAASRASPLFVNHSIPIVGFNSDPQRSEGRLMLPKQYTTDVNDAVKKLLTGEFSWMHKSRIRITLLGVNGKAPVPIDLHEYNTQPVEHKEVIMTEPSLLDQINGNSNGKGKRRNLTKRMLPYLALNEVNIKPRNSNNFQLIH